VAAKDWEMKAIAEVNIGNVYLARGDWGDALHQFELALDSLRDLHLPADEAMAASDHAIALAQLGDIEEAERELDDAIAIIQAIGSPFRLQELEAKRRRLGEIKSQRRHH
jgi:tetratricopeptide (TPR) repeat protein